MTTATDGPEAVPPTPQPSEELFGPETPAGKPGPTRLKDVPAARAKATKAKDLKVGDSWTLPQGATMVVLPDGTVVTARGQYGPLRQEGTYKAIGGEGVKDSTIKVKA